MTPAWSTACPDWDTRLIEGRSIIPFAPLYPAHADEALAVLRELVLVDVAGKPTFGEAARPWVLDFASAVFGAYDHASGRQLIREYLLLISKKNGKSTLAAGIMLTALVLNWRESAEFLILAPTVEVAKNSFDPAADMVRASPELRDLLHVAPFHRTITHRTTGATLKVVAADNDTVSGKKATAVLVDELWLFGKKAGAENMLTEATGGLAARPEGFVIYLSTQSDEPPAGVFRQRLNYFRDVRDGKIDDPRSLPVLYEWPAEQLAAKGYLDPARWHVTNPNLGASVDHQFISDGLAKAQIGGEGSLRGFLAKHLNVEIGLALRSDGWAGGEYWPQQAEAGLTLAGILARSEVVTVGIDGGGLDDLLGLSVVGRERGTGRWLAWCRAWAHPVVLKRRQQIAAQLQDFAAAGEVRIVDRVGDDLAELVSICREVADAGLLPDQHGIGVDPGNSHAVVDALTAAGFTAEQMAAVSQGWRLGGAIKLAERKLAEGALFHAGQAVMAWCVGNAKVEPKGNAMLITKQASGSAKIDPLMAMFNAVELMARSPIVAGADQVYV